MPRITHPATGATVEVPDKVVPFWTGPAGWRLEGVPAAARKARKPRRRHPPAPQTTPARHVGAPDDDPGLGSSITEPTKE